MIKRHGRLGLERPITNKCRNMPGPGRGLAFFSQTNDTSRTSFKKGLALTHLIKSKN